jgi:hypothetical protein
MTAALERLIAQQEITDVIHRYCRAMDRIDDDLGYSVWHGDAIADYGSMYQGSGAGFVDFVHGPHTGFLSSAHRVTNILIEVVGETASSETYVEATFCMPDERGGERIARSAGRYLDRWSQREGRWAIAHRRYLHDWDEGFVPSASMNPRTGCRDRSDESYDYVPAQGSASADDERLIRRTLALYGTLLDDRRFDDWGGLFTDDAEWIIPGAAFKGRQEVVAKVGAMEPPAIGHVKHLSYPGVIEIDSPTTARAWSDLVALARNGLGAWNIVAVGRYYDELRKEGGAWRFRRRQADIETATQPLPDLAALPRP